MKNSHDIENLSASLDGQLNQAESAKIKTRLTSDRELDSVLTDLSFARNILRLLPKRKSPKNFTLTRQIVGLKPPLPKTYPLFRLATVFATVLFVFSFSINALTPLVSFSAPQTIFGYGGGGAAAEAPQEAATEASMAEIMPADVAVTEDASRVAETPVPKTGEPDTFSQDSTELQNQPQVTNEALFSSNLIFSFLLISIFGAIAMFVIRQNAKRKWQ